MIYGPIRTGTYKSEVHRWFYVQEPTLERPTCAYQHTYVCIHMPWREGGGSSVVMLLYRTAPHPHQPLQCGKVTPPPSTPPPPFILPLQLGPLPSPPLSPHLPPLPIQNLLEINSKLYGA